MLILELLHFFGKFEISTLYVSNTPAAPACSSIDNKPCFMFFLFGHSMYIEIQVFSKI